MKNHKEKEKAMLNWVRNELTINKKDLPYIVNGNGNVDFNTIVPMPESLDVTSGSTNDYAMYVYLSERMTIPFSEVKKMPESQPLSNIFVKDWMNEIYSRLKKENLTDEKMEAYYKEGEILISNYRKYGAINWYDWRIKNWGCKWNASRSKVKDLNDDKVLCCFDTLWGLPEAWLRALAEKNVEFRCEWIEEQGFHGEYISDGKGEFFDNDLPMIEWEDDEEHDDI